jgi:predicted amidophosphoribosyltransferase
MMRLVPVLHQLPGRMSALLFPRRCPFCGRLLERGLYCESCAGALASCWHVPARLPETEHYFSSLSGAAAVCYYTELVAQAILRAKNPDDPHPWYAQEMADLMTVHIYGARPPKFLGGMPDFSGGSDIPAYHCIVPVPPHKDRRRPGQGLPLLLALRLGKILGVPVCGEALVYTRDVQPQKTLNLEQRIRNQKDAYRITKAGRQAVEGCRILLVDDVITTGATASACAQALLAGGAQEVFASSFAASELRAEPGEKGTDTAHRAGENGAVP